ncbi:MAG: hypothetical protein JO000_16365 [Alphaproteobacteria bacterium]|nr:hypothetical protein [Alphaproteobacteria bacterium]
MKDLERALADITAIRSQMARGTQFRGYGPVTVAAGGFLALLGGALQALYLPEPLAAPLAYLAVWIGTAALAVVLAGAEMIARARREHGGLADEMLYAAAEQYIPAGVAGTLITVVIYRYAPQATVLLPGLWQIMFSLGVFASCRSLPRGMFGVGVWYLATGLAVLALSATVPLSPLAMAVPFGVGQLMMAFVLYRATGSGDGEE